MNIEDVETKTIYAIDKPLFCSASGKLYPGQIREIKLLKSHIHGWVYSFGLPFEGENNWTFATKIEAKRKIRETLEKMKDEILRELNNAQV